MQSALTEISTFDASAKNGYLDEWEESDAFFDVKEIATKALNHDESNRII